MKDVKVCEWTVNCNILIFFLAVCRLLGRMLKWRENVVSKACRMIETNENRITCWFHDQEPMGTCGHEFQLKLELYDTSRWTRRPRSRLSYSKDIHTYQYRISAPTISKSFDFRDLIRGGRGEGRGVFDVCRPMSKHSSDHYVLFCLFPLSHLAIDAPSCMKLMHARTDLKLHAMIWHYLKK